MQCVLIVAVHEGVKTVFPVGSPTVYSLEAEKGTPDNEGEDVYLHQVVSEETDDMDASSCTASVSGGSQEDLANSIKRAMSDRLKLSDELISCLTGNYKY